MHNSLVPQQLKPTPLRLGDMSLENYLEFMDYNLYYIADDSTIRADKYQIALEKQRDEDYYLAKYFYPIYHWYTL